MFDPSNPQSFHESSVSNRRHRFKPVYVLYMTQMDHNAVPTLKLKTRNLNRHETKSGIAAVAMGAEPTRRPIKEAVTGLCVIFSPDLELVPKWKIL